MRLVWLGCWFDVRLRLNFADGGFVNSVAFFPFVSLVGLAVLGAGLLVAGCSFGCW